MAEISNTDGVINKLQEFDKYIGQSLEVLKTLRFIKEDVEKLKYSIMQKTNELSQHEEHLITFLNKAKMVSEQVDEILSPIQTEKEEIRALENKLNDALSTLDTSLESQIEKELHKLLESQKSFQGEVNDSIQTIREKLDTRIADFLYKQNALVSNLSQQIDSYQRLTESLKINTDRQSNQIAHLENQNEELRQTIEKQNQEFITNLSDLRDLKIKQLENDINKIESVLDEATEKLDKIKFKKFLGL